MSSSTFHPSTAPSTLPHRAAAYNATLPVPVPSAPAGTFVPGTKVQVGNHRVVIERYLSEGGFAHVYLVRPPKPIDGAETAVLKRVAVPDKEALATMRTEVETMKKLKGHRHIVTYIDSHASQLKGGGYEVFLLMEYCGGGGLIDFMNTRLQNRLTEPEILKIFSDVAEGVACMHYLKPPLLHRDLKVENVLISSLGSSRRYKLCDFGSTAPPRPAATTAAEGRLIEEDVQKHTTLQYRSPEMIDVYRKQPIDEKSDIWALGVLLYKLCYYTTPFEEQGQMAILNASFKFPGYPAFSDRTKKLIASMLRENPRSRPNIYQVVREVSLMRGTEIPIKDVSLQPPAKIYAGRSQSEARRTQQLPSPVPTISSPPMVGAFQSPPPQQQQVIPDIVPMRRGRPTKPSQSQPNPNPKPSPSPSRGTKGDPFAALDSGSVSAVAATTDELSNRFPTLDQFSILHSSTGKVEFDQTSPKVATAPKNITQRVTEALADDAFVQPTPKPNPPSTRHMKSASTTAMPDTLSKQRSIEQRPEQLRKIPLIEEPVPKRPTMISTGTMTSPSPPPSDLASAHRFATPSSEHRSSSQPRPLISESSKNAGISQNPRPDLIYPKRPNFDTHRSKSQTNTVNSLKPPASSRPSLEGQRPSSVDFDNPIHRSKSANIRPRPSSVYVESNLQFLRERESSKDHSISGVNLPKAQYDAGTLPPAVVDADGTQQEDNNIASNVEFLRAMEEEDSAKRKEKRSSSGSKHIKRASMPSISLSGTKTLLASRFGDAFRRFEGNTSGSGPRSQSRERQELTPIAGSEATDGRSDDGNFVEETEDISPEARRELERRRLSQEERRVTNGAAEYRKRLANREGDEVARGRPSGSDSNKAAFIRQKVKTLLSENDKPSFPVKTAGGYGRSTNLETTAQAREFEDQRPRPYRPSTNTARKPIPVATNGNQTPLGESLSDPSISKSGQLSLNVANASPLQRIGTRPSAPPKPKALRTGGQFEPLQSPYIRPDSALGQIGQADAEMLSPNAEDWETNFSKRYPSLSGLEMVETEIDKGPSTGIRIKDV
ncbi:MAG: hypothetical protein M1827_004835 [Pycnora praestabilis]|nr:MAG: hypothetical protein M1827_004835 [Pycnora praestabilis]